MPDFQREMMRATPLLALALLSGCTLVTAGQVQSPMRDAVASNDLAEADLVLTDALGARDGKLSEHHSFTNLLLAERGVIRLSADHYKESAIDLGLADKGFDVQDMSDDDLMREFPMSRTSRHAVHMGWVGAPYSPYSPRLHERLMLNGLGMLDYLDSGDAENARVESRRLDVMATFADRLSPQSPSGRTRAFTGILAGFAFDHGGDAASACRAYREAQAVADVDLASLVPGGNDPIACASDGDTAKKNSAGDAGASELLVVIAYGLVPHAEIPPGQKQETISMGGGRMALPRIAQLVGGSDDAEAPSIEVDGKVRPGVAVLNLAVVVRADFVQATREIGGNTTPFSWSSLPAHFVIDRIAVKPGTHHVRLAVRDATKTLDLQVAPGSFAATSLIVLR